ncbi:hypothetical protein B0H34DRAFT_708251 [Crassisporium funariophilum]|nr:hypothetical protein B0H34DRAFT_708251 [Crassisporium funariophilum]
MSNTAVTEKERAMDYNVDASPFNRVPQSASPTTTLFPRTSPPLLASRNGSSLQSQPIHRGMKLSKNPDSTNGTRNRSNSKSNDKGKEPIRGDSLAGNNFTSNGGAYTPHYHLSTPSAHDRSRPSTTDGMQNGRSKFRGSLLVAASDALHFKFGRRRPSIRQPQTPVILPDVIEISAPRPDEEVEERNRLREMAAQAIGLGPFMISPDSQSREDSATDEDGEDQEDLPPVLDSTEIRRLAYSRNSESAPNIAGRSPHNSTLSVSIPNQTSAGRFRSGSMVAHSPSASATITPIPKFPSTVGALIAFRQSGGVYPKYYPPSSLRIFALSKNWKSRYLLLSSPPTLVTRGQGPAVSYLHLFKSSGSEEKELERLEINEESVVFVAEEEVGGRRHVIKVGGADVGAMKKEYTHEEGGHTMWLLQITDQADAQKWITNIKNAILGQRTVRAGLIPAHTLGNNEPRGDMDVMLSIRAQGLVTSPTSPSTRSSHSTSPQNISHTDPNYASSISSHSARSQATAPKASTPIGAVSALKGLFTAGNRPRSASRAASIDSERGQDRDGNEESFTSMGSNLLNMLRSGTPDTQSIITIPSTPVIRTNLPFSGPQVPIDRRIDRKIVTNRQPIQWATTDPPSMNKDRANRALSLGAASLQPPPRKRWTSTGQGASSSFGNHDAGLNNQTNGSTTKATSYVAPRASTERPETEPPSSPTHLSGFQFGTPEGTPEQRPRAPSLQSVSTFASGDNAGSLERSSSSTKRSSGLRRWSRQGILPTRLTPPTEPPPAIPNNQSTPGLHPHAVERAPSPTISSQSSQKSVVSSLPSFSKRASGSSARSVGSSLTAHSNLNGNPPMAVRPSSSHRNSMPPPRPAPTVALPPAPLEANQEDVLKPLDQGPPSKSNIRNSAHRTFRLSTIAPKPPPSTTLPPRPDEPEYKTHRRSSSGSATNSLYGHSTPLESIPASPIPPSKSANPFPPPNGPLPPTPPAALPASNPPTKRSTSIKQRLRILSAPSVSNSIPSLKGHLSRPTTDIMASSMLTTSPPATPIAEKITLFQNDPSFLQMYTPILPPMPLPLALLPPSPEENPGVTSLSPPPRRGSKQLLETELERPKEMSVLPEEKLTRLETPRAHLSMPLPDSFVSLDSPPSPRSVNTDIDSPSEATSPEDSRNKLPSPLEPPRHLSLSRPGSVISLGILSM